MSTRLEKLKKEGKTGKGIWECKRCKRKGASLYNEKLKGTPYERLMMVCRFCGEFRVAIRPLGREVRKYDDQIRSG